MKKKILLTFVILHLVLVALGAAHFSFWNYGSVGRIIDRYGLLSGSSSTYPFFAPVVGTSIRARFDLFDTSHTKIAEDDLMSGPTRETNLRISNIVQMIDQDLFNDGTRRLLAASWAGKMFARHPDAATLQLKVEVFDIPTMEEYKKGIRYDWKTIYTASFARRRNTNVEKN